MPCRGSSTMECNQHRAVATRVRLRRGSSDWHRKGSCSQAVGTTSSSELQSASHGGVAAACGHTGPVAAVGRCHSAFDVGAAELEALSTGVVPDGAALTGPAGMGGMVGVCGPGPRRSIAIADSTSATASSVRRATLSAELHGSTIPGASSLRTRLPPPCVGRQYKGAVNFVSAAAMLRLVVDHYAISDIGEPICKGDTFGGVGWRSHRFSLRRR
eukprot:334982-Amphidinium_carterae.2